MGIKTYLFVIHQSQLARLGKGSSIAGTIGSGALIGNVGLITSGGKRIKYHTKKTKMAKINGYFQLTVCFIFPSSTLIVGAMSKTKKINKNAKNAMIAATKEFWYKLLYIIMYSSSKKSVWSHGCF